MSVARPVNNMSISNLWRRLTNRKYRKRSFYESQEVMRRAVEMAGPIDMRLRSNEELHCVLETDKSTVRRQAAERELALRASRHRHGEPIVGAH